MPPTLSYFTVYPVGNPVSSSQVLDQLLLYTEYQVVVRASLANGLTLSSTNIMFDTSSKWRSHTHHVSECHCDGLIFSL